MAIKITVSDLVKVKCAGTIADERGPQPFEFAYTARRLDADALRARIGDDNDEPIADFLGEVIVGWSGVRGDDGEIPYSREALAQLLRITGVGAVMLRAYLDHVGAKAKN